MIAENVYKNISRVPISHLQKVSDAFSIASVCDFLPEGDRESPSIAWQRISRAVLMRDHYACRICGSSGLGEVNADEPFARHHFAVQVHHIIPRNAGGRDSFGNLITLCEECHRKTFKGGYSGIPVSSQTTLDSVDERISLCLPLEVAGMLSLPHRKTAISNFARITDDASGAKAAIIAEGSTLECAMLNLKRNRYQEVLGKLLEEFDLDDYETFMISERDREASCRVLIGPHGYFL